MTHNLPLLLAFGLLIGVTTVLFGFGGGFIVVPVIYGVAGDRPDAMHIAVATSTAVMIVNASLATMTIRSRVLAYREYLWPLIGFIAVGTAIGAVAATRASESLIHVFFVAYLIVTIVDSVVRAGFLDASSDTPRPLGRHVASIGGVGIGAIASFLGVGGSIMTVPLLRRRQLPMATATALANPLTIPIAVIATIVYAFGRDGTAPGTLGYVDLLAGGALLAASLPTIVVTRRLVRHVPDRLHAHAYIVLLVASLVAILAT
ncbi:sulfite exporter TauE/SafE family protein [Rhodococcus sp. ACT016]|uniref:sulfite exporter TauE/SafE family protein n=1 Tax=Rhodococcus sp. ACT016 TaxID=3134808 RepID=UPI003D2BA323